MFATPKEYFTLLDVYKGVNKSGVDLFKFLGEDIVFEPKLEDKGI